jgi:predicted permease
MGSLHRDIRQGIRILIKNPVFTFAAAVSLGLAIGANSALFSMFNSLLWRPLPVESPGRLAVAYTRSGDAPFYDAFSWADYRDYTAAQRVFAGLAAYTVSGFALGGSDVQNAMVYGEAVSGNYFHVVKPRVQLGRGFLPDEGQTVGRDPIVVLADRFWRRQFGADPTIVGRTIKLNNIAFTVVGVAEPGFNGVYAIYFAPDLWVPITMLPRMSQANATMLDDRGNRTFRLMGRLGSDATIEQAAVAMKTISRQLAAAYPKTNKDLDAYVFPELGTRPEVEIAGSATTVALIFLAFTTLVLFIACANVANLLLSRASARRKEITMRLALGATRPQLIRQLTESILLSVIAGAF